MAHLSLGLLGPLQVLLDDTPVATFESDKVRALLVFLAVEADRPHRRDFLAGLLWPECPEEVARHNLRQALSNLRRAIGDQTAMPPYLLISRDAVQLNPAGDLALDLAAFIQGTRKGEGGPLRAARLEEAVQLYRGEFLHGFFLDDSEEFEQWALVQREGLHQRALEAHGWLAGYYEEHGHWAAARRHALRQMELDPWREEAYCQLMRALALDGQRAAALAQFETCRRVLADELGVEPSAETRELAEQIRAGTLRKEAALHPSPPATPLHSLPTTLTSFHGREQELVDLDRLLAGAEYRCISLVGPGGIGKTRLAVEAAQQHRASFLHGVAFVPLAAVGSVEAAIAAIAGAIRLFFYGPCDPRDQLLNFLCEKQMLLALDNVEQLLTDEPSRASIVELILEILQRAPGVKLLVTSREALDLQGEWVCEVRGLAFPGTDQMGKLDEYASVALFVQRARRSSPGLALDEADLAGVARVCRLVEGMPLAIELAATWSRVLSPAEIAHEIEGSLDFLSASARDLPERHRSMRAVFDQTWARLAERERKVLAQLSVFRGGFTREAAEQVAGASLPVLSRLVNRALLRRGAAGRYELHELVRQYCAGHLAADTEAQAAVEKAHCGYFLVLAEAAAQGLRGRGQLQWLGRLDQEQDNLRAALEWALESERTPMGGEERVLRLSGALRWYWLMRGHLHEGRAWLTEALCQCPERHTAATAAALTGIGSILYALGDVNAARLPVEQSAAICRELGDELGLARALSVSGLMMTWEGQARLGRVRLEEALAIFRREGDRWEEARALCRLGSALADFAGDPVGRVMLEESAAILEEWGERFFLTSVLTSLGTFDMRRGEYAAARARLERGLAIAREIEHPLEIAAALTNLGHLYQTLGEYSIAQSCLEECLQVYQAHGRSMWEAEVLCAMAENALAQGELAAVRFLLQAASNLVGTGENKWLEMVVCCFRGLSASYEGDAEAAVGLLEQAAALAREGQFEPDLARALVALCRARRARGQVVPAPELLREALALYRALGHKLGIAEALEELGALCVEQGDGLQAAALLGTAHALREAIRAPLPPVGRAAHEVAVAACRARLGENAFAEAWGRAASRSFEEVVDEILGGTVLTSRR